MQTYEERKNQKKKSKVESSWFSRYPTTNPLAAKEGKRYFLKQADEALRDELGEEIDAGEIDPKDDKWLSRVQMRALEMLQDTQDLIGPIAFAIQQEIEEQASYSYLGYQDFEEWRADSRLRKGGMYADHRTWTNTVIPISHEVGVQIPGGIDDFFLVAVNQRFTWKKGDGPSRHQALRLATPDLNILCKSYRDSLAGLGVVSKAYRLKRMKALKSEMKEILEAFYAVIADDSQSNSEKQQTFDKIMRDVRPAKMTIHTTRVNGHFTISGRLNPAQYQRLVKDLAGAATVIETNEDPITKLLQLTCLV